MLAVLVIAMGIYVSLLLWSLSYNYASDNTYLVLRIYLMGPNAANWPRINTGLLVDQQ